MNQIDLTGKKIFLAPLNWGLGHATRSIPIIEQLLQWNATVIIGGDGRSFQLLKAEYPNLEAIELPSYDVKYTDNAAMVAITLFRAPKYLYAIKKEHDVLQQIIKSHNIDYVISDNRYGLFTSLVPTVFICHQIALIPPKILSPTTPIVYRLHRLFLDRYDKIWIPDFKGKDNLSGVLTNKYPLTEKMAFVGALSRFKPNEPSVDLSELSNIDIVCVLSGPEPQRTLLEDALRNQLSNIQRNVLIVQGKTEKYTVTKDKRITTISFLTSKQLNAVMSNANVIIARSGYSTILDLAAIGKKAILIPTPGQTEQEYLAKNLHKQGKIILQHQSTLDVEGALDAIKEIDGFKAIPKSEALQREMIRFFKK